MPSLTDWKPQYCFLMISIHRSFSFMFKSRFSLSFSFFSIGSNVTSGIIIYDSHTRDGDIVAYPFNFLYSASLSCSMFDSPHLI